MSNKMSSRILVVGLANVRVKQTSGNKNNAMDGEHACPGNSDDVLWAPVAMTSFHRHFQSVTTEMT